MRKIIPYLVVSILVISGLGAVANTNDNTSIEKTTVAFSNPTFSSDSNFITVDFSEANSYIMEQGKPMVPCYEETFAFPFGTKIKSVTVTPKNIEMQTISKDIIPTPQRAIVGQTLINSVSAVDYGTEPYPANWFEYSIGGGLYEGKLSVIVDVQVNPIKYHPQEKIVEYANGASITIEYEPSTQQSSFQDNYELIVLGPSEYSSQIAPLITHKIGRGVTSRFVSLTDIYGGTYFPATGRDNQEKIKYFIKNAIENWATSSVLLVGGSTQFPTRNTHIYIEEEEPNPEIFVSDLYYADIYTGTGSFASWDSNGNDIFGEYNWEGKTDTDVDMRPDVYLGRIAATSTTQVTTMVNKIKYYENNPGYQQSWFPNIIGVGGDSFPDNNNVDEGEYINQKVFDMMPSFAAQKLWVTNGALTGWAPTGVANIKNAINAGCGFVDFSGHGNTNLWATHPHNNFNTWVPTPGVIKSSDIATLTNGNKLPIIAVEACSTAKFASDTYCFNWAFLANANGGAIGAFGATALGWGYIGTGVSQGLIGKMGLDTFRAYAIDESLTLGEMWANALNRYIKSGMNEFDYKTIQEWILFGDPTLQIGEESDPPVKPNAPSGPTSGVINIEYTYSAVTTDPNGDKIYYMFDWGNGEFSGWIGPYNSGTPASGTHKWSKKGDYNIRVIAKDTHGKLSEWSNPLAINVPRSKTYLPNTHGTFTAELGRQEASNPIIQLDGAYNSRERFKVISGTATYNEVQGSFRGLFLRNYFILKVPTQQRTIVIFGRVAINEDNTFTGAWINRPTSIKGWISGEFTPS